MHIGLTFFPTAESIHPAVLARALEERGFESLWLAEHSHIPESPATPGPPGRGEGGLPREYYAVADPFVALGMVAAVTTRLKLATGICLVAQRDVFQTAKQVASLDALSGGRFLFGVGAGWNAPELADHGTPFEERFAVMRERIAAMKQLWSAEKAEYHGQHVDFGPSYAWPKPLQQPHPPIHMGGAGITAIRRAVAYCDGWVPLYSENETAPLALVPQLQEALAAAGRDTDAFELTLYFCPPTDEVVAKCQEAGATRVLFPLPSLPESEALTVLDGYAKRIA